MLEIEIKKVNTKKEHRNSERHNQNSTFLQFSSSFPAVSILSPNIFTFIWILSVNTFNPSQTTPIYFHSGNTIKSTNNKINTDKPLLALIKSGQVLIPEHLSHFNIMFLLQHSLFIELVAQKCSPRYVVVKIYAWVTDVASVEQLANEKLFYNKTIPHDFITFLKPILFLIVLALLVL